MFQGNSSLHGAMDRGRVSLRSHRDMSRSLIAEVLCCSHEILFSGTRLVFMWVPSHVGLAGNSAPTLHAAKAALLMPVSNLTLPYSDYFPLIRTHVLDQWQSS